LIAYQHSQRDLYPTLRSQSPEQSTDLHSLFECNSGRENLRCLRSQRFKFQFFVPSNWLIFGELLPGRGLEITNFNSSDNQSGEDFRPGMAKIEIHVDSIAPATDQEWLKAQFRPTEKVERMNLGGKAGFMRRLPYADGSVIITVFIVNSQFGYTFLFFGYPQTENTFFETLDSVRFYQ